MSVKAIALVNNVTHDPSNSGKFIAVVVVAGIDPGNHVNTFFYMNNVSPTIAAAFLEADIKQGVKDELINNHGYTFGILDSVRLIGALV